MATKLELLIEATNRALGELQKTESEIQSVIAAQKEQATVAARVNEAEREEERILRKVNAQRQRSTSISQQQNKGLLQTVSSIRATTVAAIAATAAVTRLFQAGASIGISFNAQMERAQIGIAGILKATDSAGSFEKFTDAMGASARVLEQIKQVAPTTTATIRDLVDGFQVITGPASAANITLQEQVQLTVSLSNAVAALGVPTRELAQETRALISGNIDRNARVAQALQITSEDVRNAKEAGNLFEFLNERLSAFTEAGQLQATTLTGLLSNTKDALDQALGAGTETLFANLKDVLADLLVVLKDPDFVARVVAFGDAAGQAAGLILELTVGAVKLVSAFSDIVFLPQRIANEMLALEEAQTQATISTGRLEAQTRQLILAARDEIDARQQVGALTKQQADALVDLLDKATAVNNTGIYSGEAAEAVAAVTSQLIQQNTVLATQLATRKQIAALTPEQQGIVAEQEARIELEALKTQEGALQQSLANRYSNTTEYHEQYTDLLNRRLQIELDAIGRRDLADFESQQKATADREIAYEKFFRSVQQLNQRVSEENTKRIEMQAAEDEKGQEDLISRDRKVKSELLAADKQLVDQQLRNQRSAQLDLQLSLEQTNGLQQAGLISSFEAGQRNTEAWLLYAEALRVVQDELEIIRGQVEDGDLLNQLDERIQSLGVSIEQAETAGMDPNTPEQGFINFTDSLISLEDQAGATSAVLEATVGNAIDGISDGLAGLANGTMTWGQAMQRTRQAIIAELIKIGVQMLATKLLGSIIQKTAAIEAGTTNATIAASAAPAAALEGAATFGANSAGVVAVVAAVIAAIAALAATAAFEEGGLVGGGEQFIRINEAGPEYVIPHDVVREFGASHFEAYRKGMFRGSFAGGGLIPSSGAGAASVPLTGNEFREAAGIGGDSAAGVRVAIINSRQSMRDYQAEEGSTITADFLLERGNQISI
jgi:hypothetical protein